MERFAKYFVGAIEVNKDEFMEKLNDENNTQTLKVEYETIETLRDRIKQLEHELSQERLKEHFTYPPLTTIPNPPFTPTSVTWCTSSTQ